CCGMRFEGISLASCLSKVGFGCCGNNSCGRGVRVRGKINGDKRKIMSSSGKVFVIVWIVLWWF
ncbi:hypothetical protein, partial [Staphylococcus haemolyticus]|uniref:hypothetical protein n=1 Tax=Staphylococcus haemolyticus TaxID=1283 RepID=UPI00374F8A98